MGTKFYFCVGKGRSGKVIYRKRRGRCTREQRRGLGVRAADYFVCVTHVHDQSVPAETIFVFI